MPWTNVAAGKYKITAKATDSQGITKTSSVINVVVDTSPNVALSTPLTNTAYAAPAAITLNADVSAPRGSISKVQFFRGNTILATLTSAPYTTTWSNVGAGTYKLTARAIDNLGVSTTSKPLIVTVGNNAAPTISLASPTENQGLIAPATVALAATAADADGGIAQVEFFNGAALIGRVNSAPYNFSWTNVAAGTYSITARATDNLGAVSTSAPLAVTVAPNSAPTVTLTSPTNDQHLIGPLDIVLAASAADTDGGIAKLEFFDGDTLLATRTSAPYSVTLPGVVPGNYVYSAKATDNGGAVTSSAPAMVTVVANTAPAIDLTATPGVATAPAAIQLAATASDGDGTVEQVEFFNGTTSLGKTTQAPYIVNWGNVSAGTYSVTARATDNRGAVTTSQAIAVVVNEPPTIAISAPQTNSTYAAPATIQVAANAAVAAATAANGNAVNTVDFYSNGVLVGTATQAPYGIGLSGLAAGGYTLTAVATDSAGASATSGAVTVNVVNNIAPVVVLSASPNNAAAPAAVTLNATATDADGSIAQVEFFNGAVSLGTLAQAPYTYALVNLPAGNYTLTAVATDNLGTATTSAPQSVVVKALPTISLSAPALNALYGAPATIQLSASAAPAGNGSGISQVAFYSNGNFIGNTTAAPYRLDWDNVPAGAYSLTAAATDTLGNSATSGAVAVTVVNNTGPAVTVTATPANAQAPASVTLGATATDIDGSIAKVEFFNGPTLLASTTEAPYGYNWANVPVGVYSVTARATDNLNAATTSAPVTVTITGFPSQVFYIHADQLNTPRMITDANNTPVWQWDNADPFGANPANENPSGSGAFAYNSRLPGQYFDRETGLHYNYYRDYDPSTGRYVQSDPIGLAGGVNTYTYVMSQPTRYIDPLGLDRACGPGRRAVTDPRNPGGQVSVCVPDENEDPNKNICITGECGAHILPRTRPDSDACHRECSEGDGEGGENNLLCGVIGMGAGFTPIPGASFVTNKLCKKSTKDACVKKCEERNKKMCEAK